MSVRWTSLEYEAFKAKHANAIATPLPEPKPGKRVRQSSKPLMNKLESEFHSYLMTRFRPELIYAQSHRFRLGNGIWFKPDFVVYFPVVLCFEVKGPHAFRGGFENLKIAAGIYQQIKWQLVWREYGEWIEQTILP